MPKPKEPITNVHINGLTSHSFALCCEHGGARYHVWIDRATMQPGPILFKNAPSQVKQGEPGYFHTRKLDRNGAFGRIVFPLMWQAMKDARLYEKACEDDAAKEAAQEAEQAEALRRYRIEQAAPDLYAALRAIIETYGGTLGVIDGFDMQQAQAALAKADGKL